MASKPLLQALAVTAELTGTVLSESAARVMADDLAGYPEAQVLGALVRCRRELKRGQLTLAAVLERLDDGRPGPEEAFTLIPRDESESAIWTEEAAHAHSVAATHLASGDMVAARMAFREAYTRAVQRARDEGRPVRWVASWGWDKPGRERAVVEAVHRGYISAARSLVMLPNLSTEARKSLALPDPVNRGGVGRVLHLVEKRDA